jgi:multicomponent Na+:H+ antiporter subunit E
MSLFARMVLLVVVWVLAWGEITVVNVVVGTVLAAALLATFPPRGVGLSRSRIRPLAIARLVGYLLQQLVVSNVLVAREILSRRSSIHTGVIVHELHGSSEWVLTLVANAIALTPGTMTVDATVDPSTLHVHFLLLDDIDKAHRSIDRLTTLVNAAAGPAPPLGDEP